MKIDFKSYMTEATTFVKDRSPEILTAIGISGMLTAAIMAVKATPKAMNIIEKETLEFEHYDKELTNLDIVKVAWKCYIPSALLSGASIGCLVMANSTNLKRNAVLATAYKLSENSLKEYQEKTVEMIGEKKERAITDSIAKDRLTNTKVSEHTVIDTNNGTTLCYDSVSGRYFYSDIEFLRKAENELNRDMLSEMEISLNDFYYAIGLDNISIGDCLGWRLDDCDFINIGFSSQLTKNEVPCLVLSYQVTPISTRRFF